MRSLFRRAAALVLCGAMLASTALASDALGQKIYGYTLDICDETTLSKQVMWSASRQDLRTENYVTYTPSASTSPMVSYGSYVLEKQSVYTMAKDLEAETGKRVLSGINGDYFVMATGNPLGLVVTDGVLRSSASYLSALGFRADGSAVIGTPDLKLQASFNGGDWLKVENFNKIRSANGFHIFTEDFGPNTWNTKGGVDVILVPDRAGEQFTIGGTVSCTVEAVYEMSGGATAIPQGKFVLSASNLASDFVQSTLRDLKPGDTVDLSVSSDDTRWNDVEQAVGAMYWILKDGKVDTTISDGAAAPRTAVGVKADGSVIFYTIDGRQSGLSVGATIQAVAQRLKELGCQDAVLLDGGGSTTLVSTYPDFDGSTTVNSPSEGVPRKVTNAIFLLSNLEATGKAGSLYVTPKSLTLLPGAATQCAASGVDTGWWPMDELPGPVTWSAPEGSVDSAGLFTAPQTPGVYTVSAQSGSLSGSTQVNVLQPDAIYVTNQATGKNVSTLSLSQGQQVDLSAAGAYKTIDLTGGDACFTWQADPSIGAITQTGVFTAGSNSATGKIKVSCGSYAVTLSVTVDAPVQADLLQTFEGENPGFTAANATLSLDGRQAWSGGQSLRADYRPGAKLSARQALADTHRYISLAVRGDGSESTLSAVFAYTDGSQVSQPVAALGFTGWKTFSAAVPKNAVTFEGFSLSAAQQGTVWLDQVLLANEAGWDSTPPTLSLSRSGQTLTAKISDNLQNGLTQAGLSVKVDGQPVSFTWSGGTLTAALPALGTASHQITVTAADLYGNLARKSLTVTGTDQTPFADMAKHWAQPYTTRLQQLGVIAGVTSGSQVNFLPDRAITRGDFALMAAKWLGLDLDDYAALSLPYADAGDIPAWDVNAVKALYHEGVMQGSATASGGLAFHPRASITRAEAMSVLGRVLEAGFDQASLSSFSDAAAVPAWARDHVATLVGLGAVSGNQGKLLPQSSVSRAEVAKMLFTLW